MSAKIEGTFSLDGLLQGHVPPLPDVENKLRNWVQLAGGKGMHFSLEIEGGNFNLLAVNRPMTADEFDGEASTLITGALNEVLKVFPPADKQALSSTLRSSEIRRGEEVQTLYLIGPDGTMQSHQRSVPAKTTPPPEPMSRREKVRLAVYGLAVAALIFGISAFFVDYRAAYHNLMDTIAPYNAGEIKVEAGAFNDYFTIDKQAISRDGKHLVLTLARGPEYPKDAAALRPLTTRTAEDLPARLAVEAVARGVIRCEVFDKNGECFGMYQIRIVDLKTKEKIDISVPLSPDHRLTKVEIGS